MTLTNAVRPLGNEHLKMFKRAIAEPDASRQRIRIPRADEKVHFSPRGIGMDYSHTGCFVCGKKMEGAYHNIAGFVKSRVEGKQIVRMFRRGAWLDYRPNEPDWIQVKIAVCDEHTTNISHLYELTNRGNIISKEIVDAAAKSKKFGVVREDPPTKVAGHLMTHRARPEYGVFDTEAEALTAARKKLRELKRTYSADDYQEGDDLGRIFVVKPDGTRAEIR